MTAPTAPGAGIRVTSRQDLTREFLRVLGLSGDGQPLPRRSGQLPDGQPTMLDPGMTTPDSLRFAAVEVHQWFARSGAPGREPAFPHLSDDGQVEAARIVEAAWQAGLSAEVEVALTDALRAAKTAMVGAPGKVTAIR